MDYYSDIAAGYDELHGEEQDEKLREFLAKQAVKKQLTPGVKLLDIGCGTGRSIRLLSTLDWYGIEPAKGLILQAPKTVQERICLGRGEELPWPDKSFDLILSLTALQNYDDTTKGVAEMARVAKPDAIIMISFIRKSPKREAMDEIIRSELKVLETWEQSKDMMYVCRKPSRATK